MGRLDAQGAPVTTMAKSKQAFAFAFVLCLLLCPTAWSHVGSPDVYYEAMAGPYKLFVTIRTPQMIPGIAQIEVRCLEGAADAIEIVPLRVIGEGSKTAPPPDRMTRSPEDPQFFTGKLWLMESGSWQVRMQISGAQGNTELAVPVPAYAQRTLGMQKTTGSLLAALMVFLTLSLISIFGAAARESQLEPGAEIPPARRSRARIAMIAAGVGIVGILFLGDMWWTSIATANASNTVYKAPPMEVSIVNGNELVLKMGASPWHERRKQMQLDTIIPDHGHLMHLFLIRMPEMDDFYHLHPDETAAGTFTEKMPAVSGGSYAVFADIVRESGFPDTMTAKIDLPAADKAAPLTGDDSSAAAPKLSTVKTDRTTVPLGPNHHVEWVLDAHTLQAQKPALLRFRVTDENGAPVNDLEPYMGMAGHLVILRRDLGVFAHVHPAGSIPMAALMLLQKPPVSGGDSMPGMQHEAMNNEITFPYGFPQAGDYRLFLQVKRAGQVQTAVFDAHIAP
jgi:hypothetical protein